MSGFSRPRSDPSCPGFSGQSASAPVSVGVRSGESEVSRRAFPYYRSVSWERELYVLEEAIRRLNGEYDAFLYGTASRPPVENHKHVAQMIRQLNAGSADSAADRYRFSTLQGRYNSLCERWERLQEEKESGRRPGLYGHFRPAPAQSSRDGVPPAGNAGGPASVQTEGAWGDAGRRLFERYLEAKKARGESVEGIGYERFVESVEKERERLTERLGTREIVFDIAERDGKVKLVARRAENAAAAPGSGEAGGGNT